MSKWQSKFGERPLEGVYEKTVIVLAGKSFIGKTTLCSFLHRQDIGYLGGDACCIDEAHGIPIIIKKKKEALEKFGMIDIGELAIQIVSLGVAPVFVSFYFRNYIVKSPFDVIFFDGFLFSLPEAFNCLVDNCKKYNYRLWNLNRIV